MSVEYKQADILKFTLEDEDDQDCGKTHVLVRPTNEEDVREDELDDYIVALTQIEHLEDDGEFTITALLTREEVLELRDYLDSLVRKLDR